MAFFVRKIARAKWTLLETMSSDVIENYKADAIANDMRTTNNTLSLWKADTLDMHDFEPVIVINSLISENISKIDLLCVPESSLKDFKLEQVDGDTVVNDYCGLHYNVTSLTVKKLVEFADLVKRLVDSSKIDPDNSKEIIRIGVKEQKELIAKWIQSNRIRYEDLTESQKMSIVQYLN